MAYTRSRAVNFFMFFDIFFRYNGSRLAGTRRLSTCRYQSQGSPPCRCAGYRRDNLVRLQGSPGFSKTAA